MRRIVAEFRAFFPREAEQENFMTQSCTLGQGGDMIKWTGIAVSLLLGDVGAIIL
jgi:hypothetical protein